MDIDYEEMISRFDELTVYEKRNINRFYLHPQDKRICNCCGKIYDGIRENFYVKRYHGPKENRTASWETICKTCSSEYKAKLTTNARKDPSIFIKTRFKGYPSRAKEINVPFDLDAGYLISLFQEQDGKCYYTGEEINFENTIISKNRPHNYTPSLDRIVPELGYTKGNVAWCAYYVNRMKNDLPYPDFIKLCKTVSDKFYHLLPVDLN